MVRKNFVILFFSFVLEASPMRNLKPIEIPNVFFNLNRLHLEMIFDHQAKINKGWYQEGDEIFGLKIKSIDLGKVILVDSHKKQVVLGF